MEEATRAQNSAQVIDLSTKSGAMQHANLSEIAYIAALDLLETNNGLQE